MSRRWPLRITFAVALSLPFLSPAAYAQEEEKRGFSLDVFGAYLSTDPDDQEMLGLRGSYRYNDVWALDGSFTRLTEADEGDERFMDLAAKAYFFRSNRFEAFGLFGGGIGRIQGASLLLGLGAEISLGDRAFLRPEIRSRWRDDDLGAKPALEYSLGVGWRF